MDVHELKELYEEFKQTKRDWLDAWRTKHVATIKEAQKDLDVAEGKLLSWLEGHTEEIIREMEK